METFTVDKSFYDIGASDLKELWDSDLVDPTMQEVFRADTIDLNEWGTGILSRDHHKDLLDSSSASVVLHDRLMTDALGSCTTMPIKTEHSYSLASDGDSLPDSPISHEHMDDMDDNCFSTITINQTQLRKNAMNTKESNIMIDVVSIKDEPISDPDSPSSSCPASPTAPTVITSNHKNEYLYEIDPMVSGPQAQALLKHNVLLSRSSIFKTNPNQRVVMPKINIKLEHGFTLPPTPPSCSSSEDSEDNANSQPASPGRPQRTPTRLLISPQAPTRQPIHTPLISTQPKGSTGQLMLTEEEKRTLLAEGYPVPTRLPLTKAEEKSLKKIRRKIKNKISAQESRRKKKEYMDQLERKVELLVSENTDYRKKIESLEDSNTSLLSQLAKLQAVIARTHPQVIRQNK